jgi:hypothetical protein
MKQRPKIFYSEGQKAMMWDRGVDQRHSLLAHHGAMLQFPPAP